MKLKYNKKIKEFINNLFIFKKNSILFHLLLSLSLVLVINTAGVFFANIPTNKAMSLAEISEKCKSELGEEPATIIYGKEIVANSYEILSCEPEKSKAMRSIYSKQVCFDGYLSNWENKYSPIVTNISGEIKKYSVLLWPKNGYRDSIFLYKMPLVAGSVRSQSTSLDIYITKTFADNLIETIGDIDSTSDNKYEELMTKKSQIELDYETTSSVKRTFQTYFLCGIIDDSTEEYKHYQGLFGDYFVANQYLNIPIPHFTYFESTKGLYNKRSQIQTILNVYKYEANRIYGSAIETQYAFEYRMSFVGSLESTHPINSIWDTSNPISYSINQVYDLFCFGGFAPTIIVSISLLLSLTIASFCLARKIKKSYPNYFVRSKDERVHIVWKVMIYCIFFSITATIGFLLLNITKMMFTNMSCLSFNSFLTPLFFFLISLFIIGFMFFSRKEKKKI